MRDKHVLALLNTAMTLGLCETLPDAQTLDGVLTLFTTERRLKVAFNGDKRDADFLWEQGGHLGDVCFFPNGDFIQCRNGNIITVSEKRQRDPLAHQAMFVVALWLHFEIEDAAILASAYAVRVLKAPNCTGVWPKIRCDFPQIEPIFEHDFPPLPKDDYAFYPVIPDLVWLRHCAHSQLPIAQLRIKSIEQDASLSTIIHQAVACYDRLVVNDHWRLAIKHSAFGVHLGQDDLKEADLSAIAKANLRLGISTHGYYEILRALACRPSYIAFGHIFPTPTKQMPSSPQGLAKLALYQDLVDNAVPTFAIGGVDLSKAAAVYQTGVSGIAAVREAITETNMTITWRRFTNEKQGVCYAE